MLKQRCQWQTGSPISEAILVTPNFGKPNAVLFLGDGPVDKDLLRIGRLALIRDFGISSYPDVVDGKHVLVVDDYASERDLFVALKAVGYTSSVMPQISNEGEPEQKAGFMEWFNNWRYGGTLKAAGVAGLAGHALMATSGVIERDPSKINAAALLAVNSGLYARYGNGATDVYYTSILKHMRSDLEKNKVTVSATDFDKVLEDMDKRKSVFSKAEDVIGTNVIEINEGIGLASQLMVMKSGLGGHEGGAASPMFFLAGLVSAIGNGVAIFLPEVKKKDQDPALQESTGGKILSWLYEAPLRFLGYTTLIQNGLFYADVYSKKQKFENIAAGRPTNNEGMSHQAQITATRSTLQEQMSALQAMPRDTGEQLQALAAQNRKVSGIAANLRTLESEVVLASQGKKVWGVPLAMGTLYTIATLLMTITFKNRAETEADTEQAHKELFSRAALTALQLPEGQERTRAIDLMGMSLFSHHDIKGLTADEISKIIRTRCDVLLTSPWNDSVMKPKAIAAEDTTLTRSNAPGTRISQALSENALQPSATQAVPLTI